MSRNASPSVLDVHSSLEDPILESMNFLNEIRGRYPKAISFAPGAPDTSLFGVFNIGATIDIYLDHLARARGVDRAAAREMLYQYGPSRGLITDLIANALHIDGSASVDERAIIITNGAQEGMFLALRALFQEAGDVLVIPSPCYPGIIGAARLLGIEVVSVRESDGGIDIAELRTVIDLHRVNGKRVRALYVAPDYANPSGALMSRDRRHELIDLAVSRDFILIEDNAYGFTAAPEMASPTLKVLDKQKKVIMIGTFSKICLPATRVGFVIADQVIRRRDGAVSTLAEAMATIKSMITVNTSPICQAIVGGLLIQAGGSLVALGEHKGKVYRKKLKELVRQIEVQMSDCRERSSLPTWNCPRGGFFACMKLPVKADLELLNYSASRFDILWTPMAFFHLDHSGDDVIRLSCSAVDFDVIPEGVSRLSEFVRSLMP